MPSRKLRLLAGKELRDLLSARAFWMLLVAAGPLVGHAFVTAVNTYAEASGIAGGPAALAQGLSPLDGLLVPTFGAYDLVLTLLFPFIAIRAVAAEKASGAWKLMQQAPAGLSTILSTKLLALLAAWILLWIPGAIALLLWKSYGGHLYAPEVLNLVLGYLLRMLIATGVAVAAGAAASSVASAAIATLGFTVGTWVLEFVAAGRGGMLERLASHTPTSLLRVFEHGQFRLSAVAVSLVIALAGFAFAGVWLITRRPLRAQLAASALVLAAAAVAIWGASVLRPAWDLSENRRNSFSAPEEAALRQIRGPLSVTVYLAAEDPRRMDLDRNLLSKLARILPAMRVTYAAESRTGLFERPGDHYGEVWYEFAGRRRMSRSTTEPIVLELLYELAQIPPPSDAAAPPYAGHPLAALPTGAAAIYYGLWPLVVTFAGWLYFRDRISL